MHERLFDLVHLGEHAHRSSCLLGEQDIVLVQCGIEVVTAAPVTPDFRVLG